MRIRQVRLPEVAGRLFLSDLPGRSSLFAEDLTLIQEHEISTVICLATPAELTTHSPGYMEASRDGIVPWRQLSLAMEDGQAPESLKAVLEMIEQAVGALRDNQNVLVHCLAGIGRTGTLAIGVLIGVGLSVLEASVRVADAEAGPESGAQEALIEQIAGAKI